MNILCEDYICSYLLLEKPTLRYMSRVNRAPDFRALLGQNKMRNRNIQSCMEESCKGLKARLNEGPINVTYIRNIGGLVARNPNGANL